MIIIIEGMDNTGKSTLISQLREEFTDSILMHSSKPPSKVPPLEWEMRYYYQVAQLSVDSPMTLIHDRFHLGTYVYGRKYRGYEDEQVQELFELVESVLATNDTPVYLFTLIDQSKYLLERDDGLSHEKTASEYDATFKAFVEAHDKSIIDNKLLINITENGGMQNTFNTIMEFINGRR